MKIRISLFLIAVMVTPYSASIVLADDQNTVSVLHGIYKVVALRRASDIESTADTDADIADWIGREVSFSESLRWVNGSSCDNWFAKKNKHPPLDIYDPNLDDLAIEPMNPPAYHPLAKPQAFDLYCAGKGSKRTRRIGGLIRVDERVLVTHSASGSTNIILEKPLSSSQVRQLQTRLKDMKFYDGEITGELDEPTLKGVGFYAEYRGSEYRFHRTAITENLLDGLGVAKNDEGAMFQDYQPKRHVDTLHDYSPDFARPIDDLPAITLENLAELLSRLNSLKLKASEMPGAWVAGNLALGANQKEYTPSNSEMRAAALGDRINAFIAANDPELLARQWPAEGSQLVSYNRFEIRHADVMGSGRFY